MSINRRKIREKVMQVLYAYEISEDPIEKIKSSMLEEIREDAESYKFGSDLIAQVIENQDSLDERIKNQADNWESERIALIDKILLRMSIAEFLYFPDIPPKVSINEAIEIAKKFSTENSGKFVNGILDGILLSLREGDTMHKTGRGLLNITASKKSQ
jgi:transcription antitermination protein NusB